ncbi:acyl carrier protein [Nocardia colli]|uniref:Acyl carrier protein n=1 Tax=Nocardia colli TaxID=2545717 RepID=A0A5N0E814_9NOCA|nr:acyl carrier protein [Nocardia colli]KAA8884295.1 acyl carrier protein [Nocardia colli]
MPDLNTELAQMISTVTDLPPEAITGERRFDELDNWTSHTALRLFTALEDRFAVQLSLKTYFRTPTVAALAELIESARPAPASH